MSTKLRAFGTLFLLLCASWAISSASTEDDFTPIFDGKTLNGWDGDPRLWRVENGAIVGQTTAENPIPHNTFLIWRGGQPDNFALKIEFKLTNHNSGIQYRSREMPDGKWIVAGYQADIAQSTYSGILYEERGRGILAMQGQKVVIDSHDKPKVVEEFAKPAELLKHVKPGEWNEYLITAQGFHYRHFINGHLMVDVVDESQQNRRADGIIALQLHAGPPMKVEFRNISIKKLPAE